MMCPYCEEPRGDPWNKDTYIPHCEIEWKELGFESRMASEGSM